MFELESVELEPELTLGTDTFMLLLLEDVLELAEVVLYSFVLPLLTMASEVS